MYLIHSIRRPAGILLWLAGTLLASLIAAALAVMVYRARSARRRATVSAA